MLMCDTQIQEALTSGDIGITPFDPNMLQPASYDLKIGKQAATVPKNGDPRVDLEKEGVLFVPPYAPAVIWTKEQLKLSNSYVGHFGLKSKLARRGLMVSVGMQVDPGFHGPLSVTLMNMTPSPLTLSYDDDFLTLEFQKLAVPASRGYAGEFQGKTTFSSQELDPVIGFKGHALTDVVKGFEDMRDAVVAVANMSQKLDVFMDQHRQEIQQYRQEVLSMQKFNQGMLTDMKRLVEHIVGQRESTVILHAYTPDEAKKEILELFRSSDGPLFYNDIAERLHMDLEQVLEITGELERDGVIGELGNYWKRP